jgi:hypothetical protein
MLLLPTLLTSAQKGPAVCSAAVANRTIREAASHPVLADLQTSDLLLAWLIVLTIRLRNSLVAAEPKTFLTHQK